VIVRTEMQGTSGNCMEGRSEVAQVDRGAASFTLVVNSWGISCATGFSTTSMTARLFDADANIPVSATTFSGGYIFVL
jgi:hypothetical protein